VKRVGFATVTPVTGTGPASRCRRWSALASRATTRETLAKHPFAEAGDGPWLFGDSKIQCGHDVVYPAATRAAVERITRV
jgi:hypothetical protein